MNEQYKYKFLSINYILKAAKTIVTYHCCITGYVQ